MTPTEQKTLSRALQANRRVLSLLDQRIEDLIKTYPSILDEYDVDDRQPFFYGALGSDGQLGIEVSIANVGENPAFGYVRGHPDSAFVLTRVNVAVTRQASATSSVTFSAQGAVLSGLAPVQGLGLRFYDESSSRWITFTNLDTQPQQGAVVPVEAFSAYAAYNEGGFAMPAECIFPRSAVIRVEAYVLNPSVLTPPGTERLQVVFGGYKVYGG